MSEEGDDFGESMIAADAANDIVDLIASESIASCYDYGEVLTQLLQEKNLDGYTPFMSAVVFKVNPCPLRYPLPYMARGLVQKYNNKYVVA